MNEIIRVGSRESELAVAQSRMVMDCLERVCPDRPLQLVTMKTTGDKILDRTLDKVGGKGLFVKELDLALRDGRADITVHSLKDMPMEVPEDLPLLAYSRREDPADVLVLPEGRTEIDLTKPIGSSSLRRALQLKKLYPGAEVRSVRGNVRTRLAKLDSGEYGALLLAAAGLRRLGLAHRIARIFTPDEMIPAAGQGIVVVQGRIGEDYSWLKDFHDPDAALCAAAERGYVRALGGGCSSPIAAYAELLPTESTPGRQGADGNNGRMLLLRALWYEEKSGTFITGRREGMVSSEAESRQLGELLADELAERGRACAEPHGIDS